MRQVGPDRRRALPRERDTQRSRQTTHGARCIGAVVERSTQRDRIAELHEQIAAVHDDREESTEASDALPVLRQQHAQPRAFAVRRPSPHHRHRNEIDFERAVARCRGHQLTHRRRDAVIDAIAPESGATLEKEHRARRQRRLQTVERLRQAVTRADFFQRDQVGDAEHVEDVADRPVVLRIAPPQVVRQYVRARPPRQRRAQQPSHKRSSPDRSAMPAVELLVALVCVSTARSVARFCSFTTFWTFFAFSIGATADVAEHRFLDRRRRAAARPRIRRQPAAAT